MTAEQLEKLEELLGKITQGEWAITGQPDKVCAEGYTKQGAARVIVQVQERAWMPAAEQFANAELIALAPSLARRVIAAENMAAALDAYCCVRPIYFGDHGITLFAAREAYREASK